MDEKKTKELKLLENTVTLFLNVETQSRKESEAKILKAIEEKCAALRVDVAKEKKLREEGEEKLAKVRRVAVSVGLLLAFFPPGHGC